MWPVYPFHAMESMQKQFLSGVAYSSFQLAPKNIYCLVSGSSRITCLLSKICFKPQQTCDIVGVLFFLLKQFNMILLPEVKK